MSTTKFSKVMVMFLFVGCGDARTGADDGAGDGGALVDGSDDAPADAPVIPHNSSGSRLKAVSQVGADGSKAYVDLMFDSQRGDYCGYQTAADSKTRCMPLFSSIQVTSNLYADSACTQRVATISSCSVTSTFPKYLVVPATPATCGSAAVGPEHYLRGAAASSLYDKSSGTCMPVAMNQNQSYFTLGAAVPATEFVEGTLTVEQ